MGSNRLESRLALQVTRKRITEICAAAIKMPLRLSNRMPELTLYLARALNAILKLKGDHIILRNIHNRIDHIDIS